MPERPGNASRPIISEFATDPEMADLVQLFLGELPQRISAMETAWRERRVQSLARIAHQLKGAGSGYGFPTIGTAAGSLEDRLRLLSETDAAGLQRAAAEFKQLIDLCSRACASAA